MPGTMPIAVTIAMIETHSLWLLNSEVPIVVYRSRCGFTVPAKFPSRTQGVSGLISCSQTIQNSVDDLDITSGVIIVWAGIFVCEEKRILVMVTSNSVTLSYSSAVDLELLYII